MAHEQVTIKKINEVYNKIIAEPSIIMEMYEKFTFMVPGAQFSPRFKNKIWDGKIHLLNSVTCHLYAGLNHYVEEFCKKNNYEFIFNSEFAANEFSVKEAKEFIKTLNIPFEPRDYQIDAFTQSVRNNRNLIILPTGSGKSLVSYLLTRYYANKRTLIIVPTINLVNQLYSDFIDYGFDSNRFVHRISGGMDKQSDKPIVISTWQSIYELPETYFNTFDMVIGDEAHLFSAKSLIGIMSKCKNIKYRFGMTGTIKDAKAHKLVLEGLFGPLKQYATTSQLIENNHLSNFKIKSIVLNYSEETRKKLKFSEYKDEVEYLVTNPSRNKFISNLALSLKGNTIVLFRFVKNQGKPLYDKMKDENPDRKIYYITGSVEAEDREYIRKIIETESNAIILASSGVMSTGVNIKNLHNIIFASPSKSKVTNLQSIGRVLRTSKDKTMAVLYDIADDLSIQTGKSLYKNHTIKHFMERIELYNEEQFNYTIYNVFIKNG